MNKIILITFTILLGSTALYAKKPILTEETKALIKEAKAQTHSITAKQMKEKMKEGKVILLDVRDPDEWAKKSISYDKKVQISRGFLEIKYPELILEKYTKEDVYIIYCALEPRSVLAAQRLQTLGFQNVFYLEGGLKKFKGTGSCRVPKRQPIVRSE